MTAPVTGTSSTNPSDALKSQLSHISSAHGAATAGVTTPTSGVVAVVGTNRCNSLGEESKVSGTGGGGGENVEGLGYEESQLSQDLALFLSNPSLRQALADGSLDLTSYSSTVREELRELESTCISVYRSKADEIRALKDDVSECQSVLSSLHEMLLGFQADLGGLSGDIRALQKKSRTLDIQLRNRRGASDSLRTFLEHTVVPPNLANSITTGNVNPIFLQSVKELQQLYKNCHATEPQGWAPTSVNDDDDDDHHAIPPEKAIAPRDTVSCQELQTVTHRLRLVAVVRIRDYFLEQMAQLRKPQTNIRIIQVHGLLKYAPLQQFLSEASAEIATEILHVYIESMSKTLLQLFRTYNSQLLALDATQKAATRNDVVAMEEALLRDHVTSRAKKRVDVFCLGRRAIDCLEIDPSSSSGGAVHQPILAHVALAENLRYPYERLFRSLLGHLVDAVTNEHVFCRQFFQRDCFVPLFQPTLSLLLESIENYLFQCYDALCLLLMIKVVHTYRRLCRTRRIHSLDNYFDQVTKLLWPRLKTVMDGHLRSIQQGTPQKLALDVDNLHTHYVTRRFAEFCCSILLILHNKATSSNTSNTASKPPTPGRRRGSTINKVVAVQASSSEETQTTATTPTSDTASKGTGSLSPRRGSSILGSGSDHAHDSSHKSAGDKLLEDLSEMIEEYLTLLQRLADEHTSQKKRNVFQINNLDYVVCIFQERRVIGKEFNRFVELLMRQRELFVEEELISTGFSKMIAFIQQTELYLSSNPTLPQGGKYDVNPQVVESLVLEFASNWKSNIDQINRNVLSYFSNFRNGMEILKQVLTQLLLYYTRFHDIIRKVWRNKPPAFCKDLVPTNLILQEIKKYALAI